MCGNAAPVRSPSAQSPLGAGTFDLNTLVISDCYPSPALGGTHSGGGGMDSMDTGGGGGGGEALWLEVARERDGRAFYYHPKTGASQWSRPPGFRPCADLARGGSSGGGDGGGGGGEACSVLGPPPQGSVFIEARFGGGAFGLMFSPIGADGTSALVVDVRDGSEAGEVVRFHGTRSSRHLIFFSPLPL